MSRRSWFGLLAAIALAIGLEAAADWKDAYRRGRDAFEAGRWDEAVTALREAIAERSEERSGTGFLGRRYTPRYYLGVALVELGECRQAIEAFEDSERLGAIQDTIEYRDQDQRKQACLAELAAIDRSLEAARTAIREATAARQPLAELARSMGAAWTAGETSLASLQDQAERVLRQAQQRLATAQERQSSAAADEARQLAVDAGMHFRDAAAEARSRREELARRRTADARSTLESSLERAERSLRAVSDLAPFPAELGRRAAALETLITDARARIGVIAPGELPALVKDLEDAEVALESAARRPPRSLLDAAERYLAGDFAGVLEALETTRLRERRSREQICLLRAAAAWSLTSLEVPNLEETNLEETNLEETNLEETNRQASEAATTKPEPATDEAEALPPAPAEQLEAAVAFCRQLEPAPKPDPRFFSPRFIAFLTAALAPSTTPADDPPAASGASPANGARP